MDKKDKQKVRQHSQSTLASIAGAIVSLVILFFGTVRGLKILYKDILPTNIVLIKKQEKLLSSALNGFKKQGFEIELTFLEWYCNRYSSYFDRNLDYFQENL